MFGSLFSGIKARKQRKAADREQQNALQALGEHQSQLDNLFNSEYYGDYINRADNQALLKNLRNQTQQQNRQAQTQAAVMGATPEAIAAQQKNNAAMIGDTYSTIAANGANWKSNVLNNYINNSAAVHDKRYNTYMNASNMFRNASENSYQNLNQSLGKLDDLALGIVGSFAGNSMNFDYQKKLKNLYDGK